MLRYFLLSFIPNEFIVHEERKIKSKNKNNAIIIRGHRTYLFFVKCAKDAHHHHHYKYIKLHTS